MILRHRLTFRSASALAVIALALSGFAVSGCGNAQVESRAFRATAKVVQFVADRRAPGSSIGRAAGEIDVAIAQKQAIRASLDGLANSSDPWGRVLVPALCTGMQQLSEQPDDAPPASQDEWYTFMVGMLGDIAPGNPISVYQEKVDELLSTANLAQISPQAARLYLQECVAR